MLKKILLRLRWRYLFLPLFAFAIYFSFIGTFSNAYIIHWWQIFILWLAAILSSILFFIAKTVQFLSLSRNLERLLNEELESHYRDFKDIFGHSK